MPQKPKRHYNPNRAIHNRIANPKRTAKRLEAQMIFLRQMRKEKEIGPDPLYDHGRGRNETYRWELRADWLKRSREYDEGIAK